MTHRTVHGAERATETPSHRPQAMAEIGHEVMRHRLQAAPSATDLAPRPFPRVVRRGLLAGVLGGALLGLLAGLILYAGVVVVPGWEQLFADGRLTFYAFWTFMGAAAGIATIGVAAVLTAPAATPHHHQAADGRAAHDDEPEHTSESRAHAHAAPPRGRR